MGRILPLFFLDLCSSESIVVVFRVRRRIGSTVGAQCSLGIRLFLICCLVQVALVMAAMTLASR